MINSLVYLFFKSSRKLQQSWDRLRLRWRVSSYYHLSQKRFVISSPFNIGKHFFIHTDLSATNIFIREDLQTRDHFRIRMGHSGRLEIGHHCFFNNYCSINCFGKIEIGDNCQFGENVMMYDHNHIYSDPAALISGQGYSIDSIKIGNNCWVGSNVVILKGVAIGDRVVIGAGCVIHTSIPSDTLVMAQQSHTMKSIKLDNI